MLKKLIVFFTLIMFVLVPQTYAVDWKIDHSIDAKTGGHLVTGNDIITFQGHEFSSPTGDSPVPPFEIAYTLGITEYFSLNISAGGFFSEQPGDSGDKAYAKTFYGLFMPCIEYDAELETILSILETDVPVIDVPVPWEFSKDVISTLYLGVGVGAAWYSFKYEDAIGEIIDEAEYENVVFCYAPTIGVKIPTINHLDFIMEYKFLVAEDTELNYDAGGHLFLIGVGLTF